MKVLVIGCGSIGRRHIKNIRALGHDVQVYDNDPAAVNAVADEMGWTAPRLALPTELIIEGTPEFTAPAAVMICTPSATHEAVAEQLLAGGYRGPLFVEKPIALRADAPIFRTWPHPVTMVGYNWRFHPEIAPLAGLMGLMALGGTLHLDIKTDIRQWPGRGYGDELLECSHEIDLACHWLGEPTSVHGGALAGDGGAWLQLQHARATSVIDLDWRHNPAPRRYTLCLNGGTRVEARVAVGPDAIGLASSYAGELLHFLDAVRAHQEQRPFAFRGCTFAEGLRVVEICERVKELTTA